MNRFNKLGMEVIEYKKELLKNDYPEIVKKALESQVDVLQSTNIVDIDIHFGLKDQMMELVDFKRLIEGKEGTGLLKSPEELLEEYDVLRQRFEESLVEHFVNTSPEGEKVPIKTESKPLSEEVHIITSFDVDSRWAEDYFTSGIEVDVDMEKMMQRKGFVERFVVLRYSKLMNDFLNSIPGYDPQVGRVQIAPNVYASGSKVLFNTEEDFYSIEFMIYVDINALEDENTSEIIAASVDQIKAVTQYFELRTMI